MLSENKFCTKLMYNPDRTLREKRKCPIFLKAGCLPEWLGALSSRIPCHSKQQIEHRVHYAHLVHTFLLFKIFHLSLCITQLVLSSIFSWKFNQALNFWTTTASSMTHVFMAAGVSQAAQSKVAPTTYWLFAVCITAPCHSASRSSTRGLR